MPQDTIAQLEQLISIASQITLIAKDVKSDDDVINISSQLLSFNRELAVLTSPLRAYQRYANASANTHTPRV